jgi:hypothetical protein
LDAIRSYWISTLAALVGLYDLFLAVAIGVDEGSTGSEKLFGAVVLGIAGIALFAGLWAIRRGRLSTWTRNGLIAIGLAPAVAFFWMVVPPIVAIVVLVFGVARSGLARELAPISGGGQAPGPGGQMQTPREEPPASGDDSPGWE